MSIRSLNVLLEYSIFLSRAEMEEEEISQPGGLVSPIPTTQLPNSICNLEPSVVFVK